MSARTPKILNFRNLDFNKLEYFQPHKTNYGSHIGTVSYRLSKNQVMPIFIETPTLKTTSGLVKVDNKYYIEFELDIESEFYDFISNLDEKNVTNCHFNSRDWFGQAIPFDVIEDYYKSPIKLQRSGKKPTLKIKIPSYRGKILSEIYNVKRELVDIGQVETGDEIVAIITFSGLRFLSQQFIAEWELSKLKLLKSTTEQTLPSGYLFSDSSNNTEQPAPQEPEKIEEPAPQEPEQPTPQEPEQMEEPVTQDPEQMEEPVTQEPEQMEEPVSQEPEQIEEPAPQEPEQLETSLDDISDTLVKTLNEDEDKSDNNVEEVTEEVMEVNENLGNPVEDEVEVEVEVEDEDKDEEEETTNNYRFDNDFDEEYVDSEYELDDDSLNEIEQVDFYNNNEEELKRIAEDEYKLKMEKLERARLEMEEIRMKQKEREEELAKYQKEMELAKTKYNKVSSY